jgi:hypothetical protein
VPQWASSLGAWHSDAFRAIIHMADSATPSIVETVTGVTFESSQGKAELMSLRALVVEFEFELESCFKREKLADRAVDIELPLVEQLGLTASIERRAVVLNFFEREIGSLKGRIAVGARSCPGHSLYAVFAESLLAAAKAYQKLVVYLEAKAALIIFKFIFVFYEISCKH